MNNKPNTRKTNADRPFAALHRARWERYLECPSSQHVLLTPYGRATRVNLLNDVARLMDCLVSNMDIRTRKVGVIRSNGFWLWTWETIAHKLNMPLWRVKQCAARAIENGWIESTQPRGWNDRNNAYVCCASIKRVTMQYIEAFGLVDAYRNAKEAAVKFLVAKSQQFNKPIRYLLTPITMLREFKRSQQPHSKTPPPN